MAVKKRKSATPPAQVQKLTREVGDLLFGSQIPRCTRAGEKMRTLYTAVNAAVRAKRMDRKAARQLIGNVRSMARTRCDRVYRTSYGKRR